MNKIKDISTVFDEMERKGIIKDGVSIFTAGFYSFGRAETLMFEVLNRGYKNLSVTTNDCATPPFPDEGIEEGSINALLRNDRISELTISYKGPFKDVNEYVERSIREGRLKLNFIPQGTLVKRIRAKGEGDLGFYTKVGVGTEVGDGKEKKVFENGEEGILETALGADIAFIKAHVADKFGNLLYRATETVFNPAMATAGRYVVAEAEIITEDEIAKHIIPPMSPIHTPGNYIDAVVQSTFKPKGRYKIESQLDEKSKRIARRAALELKDGYVVNLGVGIPTAVTNFIPEGITIWLQSENGILGMGRAAKKGEEIDGVIDAGRNYVKLLPGAVFFDSLTSFGMINGGHVDIAMLGALQVDQYGNLANWKVPGKMATGIGGGMDLATNAKRLIVTTEHHRNGDSKIRKKCSLPLTVPNKVDMIITDMAVMKVVKEGLVLEEVAEDCSIEDVVKVTEAELIVPENVKKMAIK